MPLVVPVWPPGAQTYLGARRQSSGHMMMGRGTPQRGVAAAQFVRAGRDQGPGDSSNAGAGGNIDDRRGGHTGRG